MTGLDACPQAWSDARRELEPGLPAEAIGKLDQAIVFASHWLSSPDLRRPIRTVRILVSVGETRSHVLVAGVLLDVARSGSCPLPEVREHFGSPVAKLVVRALPPLKGLHRPGQQYGSRLLSAPSEAKAVALAHWLASAQASVRTSSAVDQAHALLPIAHQVPPFGRLLTEWLGAASAPSQETAAALGDAVVTGAAGFIGSHLVDALLDRGYRVKGVDRRDPFSDPRAAANLANGLSSDAFTFVNADLRSDGLGRIVDRADAVFHLAAMPGVRSSWGARFGDYLQTNVAVTQRLIDACERAEVRRLVYASSASVYGPTAAPSREVDQARPQSPYGVTKLAGEQLCLAHADRRDTAMSVVALRYFTVYGPRQRPDMALGRILAAALCDTPYVRFGDGRQRRALTYVDDVVTATIDAIDRELPTSVINIGGRHDVSMGELIEVVESVVGRPVRIAGRPPCPGDVPATAADLSLASRLLGYRPRTGLTDGIAQQAQWLSSLPEPLLREFLPQAVSTVREVACSR